MKAVDVSQTSLRKGLKSSLPLWICTSSIKEPKVWQGLSSASELISQKSFCYLCDCERLEGTGWAGSYPLWYSPLYWALSSAIGRTQSVFLELKWNSYSPPGERYLYGKKERMEQSIDFMGREHSSIYSFTHSFIPSLPCIYKILRQWCRKTWRRSTGARTQNK